MCNPTSVRHSDTRAVGATDSARGLCGIVTVEAVNENFSLIVMCLFLLASLAFLAQQLTSYH